MVKWRSRLIWERADRKFNAPTRATYLPQLFILVYQIVLLYLWTPGLNLVSSNRCSRSLTKIKNIQKSFLPERVIPYWNKLPPDVKNSVTVLSFKIKLGGFKKDMISKSITNDCFFWSVSNEVLIRIEGASYASNKEKHNDYLWFHPYVAKKRFINLYSTGKFD